MRTSTLMRILCCTFLIVALLSCASSDSDNLDSGQPPNVIILLADDQGWGDLSLNGNRNVNPLASRHRDPEKEDLQHTRAALAMTENIDWNVGRVVTRIEELGLTSNTIILYFTDNGPNGWRWNAGMKGRKGSTDEGGLRSPLLVRWPGTIERGLEIDQIAGAIDRLPMLAELAGIPYQTNKPLDGISLKPLLDGETAKWPDRYLFSHWRGRTSVRSQQFRLDYEGQLFNMV